MRNRDTFFVGSRRLLENPTLMEGITQYCYPSGVCDLSNLYDGISGFVLQGEAIDDWSGRAVSSAGDINGDGLDDMLVGAYRADFVGRVDAGKTYVVFGSNQTNAWLPGTFNLSGLMDGRRGFMLQGEAAGDSSGWSVSGAGDINGDGLADMLVGAAYADVGNKTDTGKTYVVFGSNQSNAWGSGVLNLTSLTNGQRGFVLQGEALADTSGWSVKSGGDINGDGFVDLLIGATGADVGSFIDAGKTYVVFGTNQTSAWGSGVLNISSLMNGQRGFVLQGEATSDFSGYSVSGGGDINGDSLDDMLVGAYAANIPGKTDAGKTYVVFGSNQTNAWGSGILNITSLMNGQRGFVLQGEAAATGTFYSGVSVSIAGDINGDGLADMLVGAHVAGSSTGVGKSYVIFGSNQTNAWGVGVLNLTSLIDGERGFVLLGEASGDNTGYSVSGAGDVNGDGLADLLVGARYADPAGPVNRTDAGKSYVVFGSDQANAWGSGTLSLGIFLDGQRGFVLQGEAAVDNSGWCVSGAADINGDGFDDVLISGHRADPSGYTDAGKSYVVFGGISPQLWANQLTVYRGMSIVISSQNLNASYTGSINFNASSVSHGQFEYLSNPGQAITLFSQAEVLTGQVQFVPDGAAVAPSYKVQIPGSNLVKLPPQDATINFYGLIVNELKVNQGEDLLISNSLLNVSDSYPANQINITINNLQHGQFIVAPSNKSVAQFTQSDLLAGLVKFVHDDSTFAPAYNVTVSNPLLTMSPYPANINFNQRPIMINNRLALETGESVVLSSTNLQAIDDLTASSDLLFVVQSVKHGYFSYLLAPTTSITQFLQQQVRDAEIQFSHDGSASAPDYSIVARDHQSVESHLNLAQIKFKNTQTASGIDLTQLYTTISTIGGIAIAVAGYLWWRRRIASHRRGFDLANSLRKAANLEYHDFMRFDGDIYKSKIENLLSKVDEIQKDFYNKLSPAEKKSFAVCIAEILEQHQLLSPSGYGMGIYGWLLAFSVGWSQQLDFRQFQTQLTDIAREAVTAWKTEEKPTTRWPYFSPTCSDKAKAWCCPKPSRAGMFAQDRVRLSRSQDVLMTELKHQKTPASPISNNTDEKISITEMSSSPRLYEDKSATKQELASLIKQEMTSQLQPFSSQMQQLSQYMQHSLYEVTGNIKKVSDRVEQLEAQPLLQAPTKS